jgi:diacylglycerol kinase family enzyme
VAAGADVVLACGGDGTVRHVARNLSIVLSDPAQATRIALCGTNRAVDVGRVFIDDRAEVDVEAIDLDESEPAVGRGRARRATLPGPPSPTTA